MSDRTGWEDAFARFCEDPSTYNTKCLADRVTIAGHASLMKRLGTLEAGTVACYVSIWEPARSGRKHSWKLGRPVHGLEAASTWIEVNRDEQGVVCAAVEELLAQANDDALRERWSAIRSSHSSLGAEPEGQVARGGVLDAATEQELSFEVARGPDFAKEIERLVERLAGLPQPPDRLRIVEAGFVFEEALESFAGANTPPPDAICDAFFDQLSRVSDLRLVGFGWLDFLNLPLLRHLTLVGQPAYGLFEHPRTDLSSLESLRWVHPEDAHGISVPASELEPLFNASLPRLRRLDVSEFSTDDSLESTVFFQNSALRKQLDELVL